MTENELKAALVVKCKIDRLEKRLRDLRISGGVGAAGVSPKVKGGERKSAAEVIVLLEEEVLELRRKLSVEKEILSRNLARINLGDIERKVIILRYVDCWSWRSAAEILGYTERRTYQVHTGAIKKISVDFSPFQ